MTKIEIRDGNDYSQCEALLDVINLAAINGDDVDNDYQPEIDEIDTQIEANEEEINRLFPVKFRWPRLQPKRISAKIWSLIVSILRI